MAINPDELNYIKKKFLKDAESLEDFGLFGDDFYNCDIREKMIDNDEISAWEHGFMEG